MICYSVDNILGQTETKFLSNTNTSTCKNGWMGALPILHELTRVYLRKHLLDTTVDISMV